METTGSHYGLIAFSSCIYRESLREHYKVEPITEELTSPTAISVIHRRIPRTAGVEATGSYHGPFVLLADVDCTHLNQRCADVFAHVAEIVTVMSIHRVTEKDSL